MDRDVRVVPYDPSWPKLFEAEAAQLMADWGPHVVYVHHVGSTSVRELQAKPIIDLIPVLDDIRVADERADRLQRRGYQGLGEYGLAGRRYFRRPGFHLHCYAVGDPEIDRHLALRDYLRVHSAGRRRYGALKTRLAALHPHSIEDYMDGKDAYVRRVESVALAWWKRVPLLLVTGPVGVGKSTVAEALSEILSEAGVAHWQMDLDRLTDIVPRAPGDPFAVGPLRAAVKAVWPVMRSTGARVAVFPRVFESRAEVSDLAKQIPGSEIWMVRLRASLPVLTHRVSQREQGASLRWHTERAQQLAGMMDQVNLGDLVLDTDDKTAEAVAQEVWHVFRRQHGWLFGDMGEGDDGA